MRRKAATGFVPAALAALALALAPLMLSGAAWAKPPVWTAHGRGATITLFGSVHLLPQDMDWRPEALTRALGEADELWFETPMDDASVLDNARLALAQGLLPDDRNLADMLSDQGKARLRRAETELRLPGPALERLRPWLAEVTIDDADYAALRAHGFSDEDAWDIAAITALFALSNRMANATAMRPNDEFYLMGRVPRAPR